MAAWLGDYLVAWLAAATILCVAATAWEVRTGHIPNGLALVGIAAGLGASLLDGCVWLHVTGLAIGFGVPFALYVTAEEGTIGGGAVKLMGATGSLIGPLPTACFLVAFLVRMLWYWRHADLRTRHFAPMLLLEVAVMLAAAWVWKR